MKTGSELQVFRKSIWSSRNNSNLKWIVKSVLKSESTEMYASLELLQIQKKKKKKKILIYIWGIYI